MKIDDSTPDVIYYMQNKEFCDLCGIKDKALRYYMANDCIDFKMSSSNKYHIFNNESFQNMCNIKMLNSIGFTFQQINKLNCMEPTEIVTSYKQKEEEITQKMKSMENALGIIKRRISLVEKTQGFQTNIETSIKEFPYKYIYPQRLTHTAIVDACLASKMGYATVAQIKTPIAKFGEKATVGGYATNDIYDIQPLWTKDPSSRFIHSVVCQREWTDIKDANSAILLPTVYINDAVLAVAPDKKAAAEFTQSAQPIEYSKLLKVLSSLGFDIKNLLFVWIINATVRGIRHDYFDFYIEF